MLHTLNATSNLTEEVSRLPICFDLLLLLRSFSSFTFSFLEVENESIMHGNESAFEKTNDAGISIYPPLEMKPAMRTNKRGKKKAKAKMKNSSK